MARDPGAAAEGLVDGLGGGADGGLDVLPRVVVQLGEVAALRLEDHGELAGQTTAPPAPPSRSQYTPTSFWLAARSLQEHSAPP